MNELTTVAAYSRTAELTDAHQRCVSYSEDLEAARDSLRMRSFLCWTCISAR
jgi:hypothetical protein